MESIELIVATVLATVVGGGITYFLAKKAGLGEISESVREEAAALVSLQKDKIAFLEGKIKDLTERVESLEAERVQDKREIERLRKVIADKMMESTNDRPMERTNGHKRDI